MRRLRRLVVLLDVLLLLLLLLFLHQPVLLLGLSHNFLDQFQLLGRQAVVIGANAGICRDFLGIAIIILCHSTDLAILGVLDFAETGSFGFFRRFDNGSDWRLVAGVEVDGILLLLPVESTFFCLSAILIPAEFAGFLPPPFDGDTLSAGTEVQVTCW
jgi:hypothetical protein